MFKIYGAIDKIASDVADILKMERKRAGQKKLFLYGIMILLLLTFQKALFKVGRTAAGLIPYERFDPYKTFALVSIQHFTVMLITLAVIILISRLLKIDFGFSLGARKKGDQICSAVYCRVCRDCDCLPYTHAVR